MIVNSVQKTLLDTDIPTGNIVLEDHAVPFSPERLTMLRNRRQLTQAELAEQLSLKQGTISKYESSARPPSRYVLEKMSSFFGVSVGYLLGETDQEDESSKLRKLKQGPVILAPIYGRVTAGYPTLAEKEGWFDSDHGDACRDAFINWLNEQRYSDGSSPFDWVEVQYGDDNGDQRVTRSDWSERTVFGD